MHNARYAEGATWSRSWSAEVQDSLYLLPGGLYIGNQVSELKTLLGSCVAVTLWHPRLKIVAMTHIVLPGSSGGTENPKYAVDAIQLLARTIKASGLRIDEFETKVYGGGRMFGGEDTPKVIDVGKTNVTKTLALLKEAGFRIRQKDVLGSVYRHIILNRDTGGVALKRTSVSTTMG